MTFYPHKRGPCPVPLNTIVEVQTANGDMLSSMPAKSLDWDAVAAYQVIAYSHDGGPCPVAPDTLVKVNPKQAPCLARHIDWSTVTEYELPTIPSLNEFQNIARQVFDGYDTGDELVIFIMNELDNCPDVYAARARIRTAIYDLVEVLDALS